MSTVEKTPEVDTAAHADNEAAALLYSEGKPFPPDLVRSIQERAARYRQELLETAGFIDVDKLIQESRDER
jgi:hypothetical protein